MSYVPGVLCPVALPLIHHHIAWLNHTTISGTTVISVLQGRRETMSSSPTVEKWFLQIFIGLAQRFLLPFASNSSKLVWGNITAPKRTRSYLRQNRNSIQQSLAPKTLSFFSPCLSCDRADRVVVEQCLKSNPLSIQNTLVHKPAARHSMEHSIKGEKEGEKKISFALWQ